MEFFREVPAWFWTSLAFVYGAIVGSFLNVCIYRIPRHEEIVFTPSHCPSCGERIPWYLNIPIVSWFFLLGRTACCGNKLTFRYPLVEFTSAAVTAYLFSLQGFSFLFLSGWLFASFLIVLIFIDWEHMLLPNVLTLPGTLIGLIFAAFGIGPGIVDALIGLAVGAGGFLAIAYIYKMSRGAEGLGMGDVKLMAMIGVFLGWKNTLMVVMLGSIVGLFFGIIVMIKQHSGTQTRIPFGVFLGIAALATLFWGDAMLAWYISFFTSAELQ